MPAEASAKAGSFGGFRRSFDRCHGCPAYVARLLRRSRLKPWGSTLRGFSKKERYHTMPCRRRASKERAAEEGARGRCLCGGGDLCYRTRPHPFDGGDHHVMARGREKDRKIRRKHRKNVMRVKALGKARRAKGKKR